MASDGDIVAAVMCLDDDVEDFQLCGLTTMNTVVIGIMTMPLRRDLPRIENYVEEVVPKYSPDSFRTFFRVSRSTFETIATNIAAYPELHPRQPNAGRPQISIEKDLLMGLWYLGSQETVRSIADRFDVSLSTFNDHNRRLLDVFTLHLKTKFISWPARADYRAIIDNFQQMKGFPDVLGAIDGTHIRIKPPHEHAPDYINRKKFHSILLQGVCRENRMFTDINVGWPGRVHDARVLKNSQIWLNGPVFCGRHHLLGDGAYPCKHWLLTPYRDNGHLQRDMVKYNRALSGTRVVIENTFGILKGRFRRLQFVDMVDNGYICKVIVTACILHNMCILEGDELEDHFEDDIVPPVPIPQGQLFQNDAEGPLKRLQITNQLANM
ncbi:protein ANTAGONIST OF LIKE HETEROCHROMATIN PROTEIN 1-like [Mizuhopecten yessoensis]|uniref:protein ANTAGONIST OF LIKE HETEROCHROMATIN PROTEIN 1-like n=1 Tax=Mizuhopecten yessoensis TaxID=6573 RepID=UPI000B459523|nr:protein ANTAGONIST OF LIKE HETEROCHROMATIN PROTEIN 1-like [Mizuhopecten yessoensis]